MRWILLLLPFAGLAVIGCSSSKGSDMASDTAYTAGSSGGDTSDPTNGDTGFATDSGAQLPPPVWYALNAELELSGGELASGIFRIQVFGKDTELEPNCTSERVMAQAERQDLSPDPTIYQWWQIQTEPDTGNCDGASTLPEVFYLGLGALHIDLIPALSRNGLDPKQVSDTLYGAYASLPGSPICGGEADSACVFGYAGTAAGFAGKLQLSEHASIPNGTYTAIAAYLFPVDG